MSLKVSKAVSFVSVLRRKGVDVATVIFDCMRHGEKDGDALTPKGVEQVRQSARKNLSGCLYTLAFFSGLTRARQTVETVLASLSHREMPILLEEGFSYVTPMKEAEQWMGRPYSELKEQGKGQNVEFWFKNWAPTLVIRGQILATMRIWAELKAQGKDCRVLVGSHGPAAEAGCLDPATTPSLREADIIRYTWEAEKETARLVSSVVLKAPY